MRIFRLAVFFTGLTMAGTTLAQVPYPALIGYFHNWQDWNAPYIQLDQIDTRYNIICVAFAVPEAGTDYKMQFIPDQVSPGVFKSQIQTLQMQGRKVLISIGGATAPVSLDNIIERDTFISRMNHIITTYGFDGMDIDLEGSSLSVSGGTIPAPVNAPVIHLIDATRQIMANYHTVHQKRMILTMAPETAYVQGGQSAYTGVWGAYLPVIHALRDSVEILHVQLYNSGSMYGIDGLIYHQGTADFIVAMCEAVIQGFNTQGGWFNGLAANKIAVGLPACSQAAGGGFTDTATVRAAIEYLRENGSKPGTYTLAQAGGYPGLRGMMTWSINWDASTLCGSVYEFAANYERIFGLVTAVPTLAGSAMHCQVSPNPATNDVYLHFSHDVALPDEVSLYNSSGQIVFMTKVIEYEMHIDLRPYPAGFYFIKTGKETHRIIHR